MMNNALYYPYINFHNVNWIKAMAMYYENIYRIVPDNMIPNDPEELRPLLEDYSIGSMIDPVRYTQDTASTFLEKSKQWQAAALIGIDDEDDKFARLHANKIDRRVKEFFYSIGYAETESWVDLPIGLASNYMFFLASEIGKRNRLNLITDDWAPWTATTYFNLNGGIDECLLYFQEKEQCTDDPFALFSLILSEIVPMNISEIPAEKILEFRTKRKDEITNFRISVSALYKNCKNLRTQKYDMIISMRKLQT